MCFLGASCSTLTRCASVDKSVWLDRSVQPSRGSSGLPIEVLIVVLTLTSCGWPPAIALEPLRPAWRHTLCKSSRLVQSYLLKK